MSRINVILGLILVISAQNLIAQENVVFIEIDTSYQLPGQDIKLSINNVALDKRVRQISIPISENEYDTIRLIRNQSEVEVAILRLVKDESYILKFNPCSFYTIEPKINPLQGMTHFRIIGNVIENYFVGIDCLRKLETNQTDEFYYSPPSAMCPFAPRAVEIRNMKEEIVKRFNYHFLHGELIGIEYNSDSDVVTIKQFGHIKSINEYRYKYNSK